MDYPSRPFQDFELRVSRTGMPNPTEPPPVVDQLAAAGSPPTMPVGDSGPTFYKAEMAYMDGHLLSVELGPFPKSDFESLRDPQTYGRRLFDWLVSPPLLDEIRRGLVDQVDPAGPGLFGSDPTHNRLRLTLDVRDPELHAVKWEMLWEHDAAAPPISIQTSFSRFVRVRAARAWPVSERPLRMITVLSNPSGLQDFDLMGFDERFHKHLVSNAARPLGPLVDLHKPVYNPTPEDLRAVMKRPAGKEFHIVHLVAHSIVEGDQAFLLLADDKGNAQTVAAEVIRDAMKSIVAPYLVFLATPVTRGESEGSGLIRLAPMLLATGVQAVVVVPSAMKPEALQMFTECFYEELLRSGTIDTAVSDARKRVFESNASSHDWSRPVLYLRTPDARLFLDAGTAFESAASAVSF